MFDGILDAMPCLSRFPPLGLHKEIVNSPGFLILFIHTKHTHKKKDEHLDWPHVLISFKKNSSTG